MNLVITDLVIGYDKLLTPPLSLSLDNGQSVAIIGRSGCGKTTLLNTILGMLAPLSGRVSVAGTDVHRLGYVRLAQLRSSKIGTVFQNGELIGTFTALDNVILPRLLAKQDPGKAEADGLELSNRLGIEPPREASDLSGVNGNAQP